MDVAADSVDVGSHEVRFGGLLSHVQNHRFHGNQDALLLLRSVKIGHVT